MFTDGLISLFFPNLCLACGSREIYTGAVLCIKCQHKLPQTQFHFQKDNAFTQRFWGRLPLFSGAALFRFTKGGHVQHLIHQLKYKGKKEVGIKVGEFYGRLLMKSPLFSAIDLIIPVPLHSKKKHIRGYNQSSMIAKGLSKSMEKPWLDKGLLRIEFSDTQTRKSRMDRLDNVSRAFVVGDSKRLKGKHILLVDDVITTGATLESCGLKILEVPNTRLSMLTLAIANV